MPSIDDCNNDCKPQLNCCPGMPFEHVIYYHKLSGRLAFINGVFHTYSTYVYPLNKAHHHPPSEHALTGLDPELFKFGSGNMVNTSRSCILMFMLAIVITSLPHICQECFEVFYYLHIIFVIGMIGCAFFHTRSSMAILASVSYGMDMLTHRGPMACILYPQRHISGSLQIQ